MSAIRDTDVGEKKANIMWARLPSPWKRLFACWKYDRARIGSWGLLTVSSGRWQRVILSKLRENGSLRRSRNPGISAWPDRRLAERCLGKGVPAALRRLCHHRESQWALPVSFLETVNTPFARNCGGTDRPIHVSNTGPRLVQVRNVTSGPPGLLTDNGLGPRAHRSKARTSHHFRLGCSRLTLHP